MAAKRRGFTRRNIKRDAMGRFARVAGSARKARDRRRNRRLANSLLRGAKRRVRAENRRNSPIGRKVRRGILNAKGSALRVQMAHQQRKRRKLQTSVLNYYVHGTQDRTFRRQARRIRRGR